MALDYKYTQVTSPTVTDPAQLPGNHGVILGISDDGITPITYDSGLLGMVSQGPIGIQGIQGTQGMRGSDGTSGTQGPAGPQGIKGTDGSEITWSQLQSLFSQHGITLEEGKLTVTDKISAKNGFFQE